MGIGNSQNPIAALLEAAAEQGIATALQVDISSPGVELQLACGKTSLETYLLCEPVHDGTRFDIASVSKALSTSVLLMQALDEGVVGLDDNLSGYFSFWRRASAITVRQLACHRAGLPAHREFFRTIWAEKLLSPDDAKRRFRELIYAEPIEAEPDTRTIYSDLGYILLGWLLEKRLGTSLKTLFERRIAAPLGLVHTGYGPVSGPVAATELDTDGVPICGVVHDENARCLGGQAGHAGLFSTAGDVGKIMRHLARVYRGETGIVRTSSLREFWRPIAGSSFTLGWDTPTPPSLSGRLMTPGATVGHLGFTGCSVWYDIARDVTITLLTNRVHPTRDSDGIQVFRPQFHDAVNRWLTDKAR